MTSTRYGRDSLFAPATPDLAAAWREATECNKTREEERDSEWVPVDAIRIVPNLLPRQALDAKAIEQYMIDFDALPEPSVQKDTFTLVAGHHRLIAAKRLGRKVIRVKEVDIADEVLWEEAFQDNRRHGVPLTQSERRDAARRCITAHPDWSDTKIAEWAGVDRRTLARWREHTPLVQNPDIGVDLSHAPTGSVEAVTPAVGFAPAEQLAVGEPSRTRIRTGRDGRAINTANIGKAQQRKAPETTEIIRDEGTIKASELPQLIRDGQSLTLADAQAMRSELEASAIPPNGTNGHASNGHIPELQPEPQTVREVFSQFIDVVFSENARSVASDIPDEEIGAALEIGKRLQQWMLEYTATLQERVVMFHHTSRGNGSVTMPRRVSA